MMKFGLAAALLVAAAPALAQQAPSAPPPPSTPQQGAFQKAAQANGLCIRRNIDKLAATVTPEAGASTVFGACAAERQTVKEAAHAWIATIPQDQQAAAREQLDARLAAAEKGIANAIRQSRGEAPAPAPAQ